jgi:hypothetical protein
MPRLDDRKHLEHQVDLSDTKADRLRKENEDI